MKNFSIPAPLGFDVATLFVGLVFVDSTRFPGPVGEVGAIRPVPRIRRNPDFVSV